MGGDIYWQIACLVCVEFFLVFLKNVLKNGRWDSDVRFSDYLVIYVWSELFESDSLSPGIGVRTYLLRKGDIEPRTLHSISGIKNKPAFLVSFLISTQLKNFSDLQFLYTLYIDIISDWEPKFNSDYSNYLIVKENFYQKSYSAELWLACYYFVSKPGFLFVALSWHPFWDACQTSLWWII